MKHLHRFFSSDASGGIILIIAAILAMIMANSGATSGWYHDFLETPVQFRVGSLEINKNMLLWINDALMAVFFLLVGLEVKRELMQGSLASLRQAAFPVIAAIGGMIVPALLYLAFNYADPITREGWAIPAATDIAFAGAIGKSCSVSAEDLFDGSGYYRRSWGHHYHRIVLH